MSLKNNANGKFGRLSTGPLYSARELRQTLDALAREGFTKVEDNKTLGMSIYQKLEDGKKTADACLYLDECGCHPNNSGMMIISTGENNTKATTVWEYAKEKRIEAAPNAVMKVLRRLF